MTMRSIPGAGRRRAATAVLGALLLVGCWSASALAGPVWELNSMSNTTAEPGGTLSYQVTLRNVGDTNVDGSPYTVTARLPAGITGVDASDPLSNFSCPGALGASVIVCTGSAGIGPQRNAVIAINAQIDPGASGVLNASFSAVGGGSVAEAETVDPVRISSELLSFGIDGFDARVDADATGTPLTQAADHPYAAVAAFDVNTHTDPHPALGPRRSVEPPKSAIVTLPAGIVGDPSGVSQCTAPELANTAAIDPQPLCAATSQVGTIVVRESRVELGPLPVFNMVPPPDAPARFGFNVGGAVVLLDATVTHAAGEYQLVVRGNDLSEGLSLVGSTFVFWGVPSDPSHDPQRACPGQSNPASSGPTCSSGAPREAFLRNPTACTAPGVGLDTSLRMDSWEHPGAFTEAISTSHLSPGFPFARFDWGQPQGPDGCARVPFDPAFSANPLAGAKAATPGSMAFDITLPQSSDPDLIGQSDLKKATVTLPLGMRVSPASADGLQACSSAQIALDSDGDASCPDASRLGTVTIDTPLLNVPVTGYVYLARPFDNPFDSLIAIYLVAKARGVVLKLPGQVRMDPDTGQITTTFDDNPQLPFSRLHLEFKTGPRTPLVMPSRCGVLTTHAVLEGWNGRVVPLDSSFTLTENGKGQPCPPKFLPGFRAGTSSNGAGTSAPFLLQLTREDEDQDLAGITVHLPRGLTGKPAAVSLCGEAAARAAACPDSTRVGSVTVGAGAGSNPFYITNGRAYFTGPYKGAPFGLEIVVPAIAGPFDLGNVTVRQALYIDKHDATVRVVSDPLPTILQGIPLDVRDVRVTLDRSDFIVNPTSCAEKRIDGTVQSTAGAVANVSDRFQAAECSGLKFAPRMALSAGSAGHTGRNAVVPFSTTLRMPSRNANLKYVRVTLPKTINARLTVINRACTRVQYEAGRCENARAGTASARTPLLRDPLRGNVYFVKNGHPLPDLFVALRGQVEFDLIGRITIPQSKYLATTFDAIPDVPVSSFTLSLVSGAKGSVGAATNLCTRRARNAKAQLDYIGQNGKVKQIDQRLNIRGCGKQAKKARRGGRRR